MTRDYGHLPREIHPLLPHQYTVLKDSPAFRGSPYALLADLYQVSYQRIQQVVLIERKKADLKRQREAERLAKSHAEQ